MRSMHFFYIAIIGGIIITTPIIVNFLIIYNLPYPNLLMILFEALMISIIAGFLYKNK